MHNGYLRLTALILTVGLLAGCQSDKLVPVNPSAWSDDSGLADHQDIRMIVQTPAQIHTGEPFTYQLRVLYRADKVEPDFTGLLRAVRFVPFEQLHLSRPAISNTLRADGTNEYELSYPVHGITVVPHRVVTLDPVRLSWRVIATGETSEVEVQPDPVQITGYYPPEISGQLFQSLQPAFNDHYLYKQLGITAVALLLLIAGSMLVYGAARRRNMPVTIQADLIRLQFDSITTESHSGRDSLLFYERLLLTLLLYYRKYTAHHFWTREPHSGDLRWMQLLQKLKQGLRLAYQGGEPDTASVTAVKDSLQDVFNSIGPDISKEKQSRLDELQGTLMLRICQHRLRFVTGSFAIISGLLLVLLLVCPTLWRDGDLVIFNNWVNSLPEKMFDSGRDNELGIIDVQMLVQISEQQEPLQQLQADTVKSAYLYNFGTIVARAYVAILTAVDQNEEEIGEDEATNRPSFEFPMQLLANAVRLFPHDERVRRNLELAIMWREREKKDEESGKVQGEVGPPLPGFSRDMNQLLF